MPIKIRFFFVAAIVYLPYMALFAQKHDYNCIMGYAGGPPTPEFGNMRLSFQILPPQVYSENRGLYFGVCGGPMSDSSGNLLFYTNGLKIYNSQNQVMENGSPINPGPVWNSSDPDGYPSVNPVFALPKPGSPHIYYILHSDVMNANGESFVSHLYYSVIDVKANNGAGAVLQRNEMILEGDLGWPSAVKHGNGRDWWIMISKRGETEHYLYMLSPAGITGPFIQDIGPVFEDVEYPGKSIFSQSGNIYARLDSKSALRIYDFDRCWGQLSNVRVFPFQFNDGFNPLSLTFSPNDHFLYLARPRWVWTLDLQAPNIAVSFDTLAYWELNYCPSYPWGSQYWMGQLMPDNKIYFTTFSGSTRCMNVIHRPDLPGDAADCEECGLSLPRFNRLTTCHFPNYQLGEWNDAPCDTINAQLPGDGFMATLYSPEQKPPQAFKGLKNDYKILHSLPTATCENCKPNERALLNNISDRQ